MVCKKDAAKEIIAHVKQNGINAYEIGKIVPGEKKVCVEGNFDWN